MSTPYAALVITVVHHPGDARIRHREIEALLSAGWHVTYAAPWTGYDLEVPANTEALTHVDLPRARGRHRLSAARAARKVASTLGREHDVILIHDPELLMATAGLRQRHTVWDVHEDTASAVVAKDWLPERIHKAAAGGVRMAERVAERRMPLLLAEYAYNDRFHRDHPVVPNTVAVPEAVAPVRAGTDSDRVVYLGNNTMARGAAVLAEAGRILAVETDGAVTVEVIGPAQDSRAEAALSAAHHAGHIRWHGFVPSSEALQLIEGAMAGLSLLRDLPNYRHSMPTKVVEYMGRGLPVITTPLPLAIELVDEAECGLVVPFDDARAVADAVLELRADPQRAQAMATAGYQLAKERYDWNTQSRHFIEALEEVARERSPRRAGKGVTAGSTSDAASTDEASTPGEPSASADEPTQD